MPCNETWDSSRGEIAYHDLDDRHLGNIVRFLERQIRTTEKARPPKGLMGTYGSQDDVEDRIEEKKDQLVGLKKEQQRRDNEVDSKEDSHEEELRRFRAESMARIHKQSAKFRRRGDPT